MKIIMLLLLCSLCGCATSPKPGATTIAYSPNLKTLTQPQASSLATPATITPIGTGLKPSGLVPDTKEIDSIIASLSQALKTDPYDPGIYFNRSIAYYYKKNYNLSWSDLHKAEALGLKLDQKYLKFLEKIQAASGRRE